MSNSGSDGYHTQRRSLRVFMDIQSTDSEGADLMRSDLMKDN